MKIPFEVDSQKNDTNPIKKKPSTSLTKLITNEIPTEEQIQKPISVTQLTRQITILLESEFRTLTVDGELSNVKRASSGHLYFILKDDHSQIRGVMFRQFASST